MPRPVPRIPRTVSRPKPKADPKRNAKHLDFIRSLPCVCCGQAPRSEAAHIRTGTDGGVATKPSDKYTVPLASECHRRQHQIGENAFWADVGIDPMVVAARLWAISGDEAQGLRVILRAQQGARLRASV